MARIVRLRITNWEKYNPKTGQKHQWFRTDTDLFTDQKMYGLSPSERWGYLCLLASQSRSGKDELCLNLSWFASHYRLKSVACRTLIDRAASLGLIEVIEITEDTHPKPKSRELSTNERTNERNVTNERLRPPLAKTARVARPPSRTSAVWEAYRQVYQDRYHIDPVRNAKVNGQLANLVARVGEDEAPGVAQFYVRSQLAFYVQRQHPVDFLVRDCETLRSQWKTGKQVTRVEAKAAEDHMQIVNSFGKFLTPEGDPHGDSQ